ncbi:MAG: CRISPR system precrRNA processing endoribonuclease RAMP protein Cas6 [Acidimicrobiales bacterium]
MPRRFRLLLRPKVLHERGLPEGSGIGVRAALLEAVERHDRSTAAWLHDRPGLRPYCVTPIMGIDRRQRSGPHVDIGISLDDLVEGFRHVLTGIEVLKVGQSSFYVTGVEEAGAPYGELLSGAPASRRWSVRFVEPTTVRTTGPGTVRSQPLPTPEAIFGSLLHRWRAFSSVALPESVEGAVLNQVQVDFGSIQVKKAKVVPERHDPARPAQREAGCVGTVTYSVGGSPPPSTDTLRGIGALLLLGGLCGAGDRTAVGMGVIEPFPDAGRPPPRTARR